MNARMRMIAAGAAVALITGAASAAAASAGSSSSPSASSAGDVKPSPTATGGKTGDPGYWINRLAASLHVDPQRLNAALADAKETIGRLGVAPLDPRVVAVLVRDLGISTDQATTVIKDVFGTGASGKPGPAPGAPDPRLSSTLAGILHVSQERAAQVLEQLGRIQDDRRGQGIDPNDPRYRAIAASLHITPEQLSQDLLTLKQDIRSTIPTSTASPAS
jgi:hypothetical protein